MEAINAEMTKTAMAVGTAENEKNNVYYIINRVEGLIKELTEEKQIKEESLKSLDKLRESLQYSDSDVDTEIKLKEGEKAAFEKYLEEIQQEKEIVVKYLNEISQNKESMDEILSGYQSQKYELEIKQAKNETQLDSYKDKLWEEFEVSYIQAIEYRKKDFVLSSAVKESREIKNRMKELGEVNIGAIKEYETVKERHDFLTEQRNDILTAMNSLKQIINDMDKTIKHNFKECFDKIVLNFEGAFQE